MQGVFQHDDLDHMDKEFDQAVGFGRDVGSGPQRLASTFAQEFYVDVESWCLHMQGVGSDLEVDNEDNAIAVYPSEICEENSSSQPI